MTSLLNMVFLFRKRIEFTLVVSPGRGLDGVGTAQQHFNSERNV